MFKKRVFGFWKMWKVIEAFLCESAVVWSTWTSELLMVGRVLKFDSSLNQHL